MKRFIAIIITVFFCALMFTLTSLALSTSARSAILIDADSGTVLFDKNAHERLPMASTTKIMTALVALENADLDKEVSVSPNAVGVEGSSVCLKNGEVMTLEELLYAMLLESANDAAAAIAIDIGSSIEGFAEMMNQKAQSLGLDDTSFENPHGLDGENHYTTAHDLARITAAALKNPDFARIVSTYKYRIPMGDSYRYLLNHNKLLRQYEGAIGVKTGFTKKSGRCLVSAAEKDGLKLIAVTLSCPDDWHDHSAMLDFGFENFERRKLASDGEFEFELECVGRKSGHVKVKSVGELSLLVNKGDANITQRVNLPRFVYAPKEAGEETGSIEFYLDGKEVGKVPLVISEVY